MQNIVVARGLVKRYGTMVALDGLDLTGPLETILGLLGPNGASGSGCRVSTPPSTSI